MTSSIPTPKPRKLFIHIGQHKTGSKWIQKIFSLNAAILRNQGILYPLPADKEEGSQDVLTFNTNAQNLFKEDTPIESFFSENTEAGHPSLLFSSEDIYLNILPALNNNKNKLETDLDHIRKLGFQEIHFLLLTRSITERTVSQISQRIKSGSICEMPDDSLFVQYAQKNSIERICSIAHFIQTQPDCSLTLYNYDAIKDDMVSTLEQWLQLPAGIFQEPAATRINRSLTYEEMYLLTHLQGKARERVPEIAFKWLREIPDLPVEKQYPSESVQEKVWEENEPFIQQINAQLTVEHQLRKKIFPAFQPPLKLTFHPRQLEIFIQVLSENRAMPADTSIPTPQPPVSQSKPPRSLAKRLSKKLHSKLKSLFK
jgi:hypothetical protein